MATAAVEQPRRPVVIEESTRSKVVRVLRRGADARRSSSSIGLFWLMPTLGLFITSLLLAGGAGRRGWWNFLFKPSKWTLENYRNMFDNEGIVDALIGHRAGHDRRDDPADHRRLARRATRSPGSSSPAATGSSSPSSGCCIVPIQMALIPMFRIYNTFSLFDTVPGLILFHTAFALPFAIFLLRNFFAGIPRDLMEAARIDGASELRLFFKVVLPLGLPGDRVARDLPGAVRLERPPDRARARPGEPADRADDRASSCGSSARTST